MDVDVDDESRRVDISISVACRARTLALHGAHAWIGTLRAPRYWAVTVSGSVFLLPDAFSVVCTARMQLGIEGHGGALWLLLLGTA